jgi:sigma-E factor negative regulatory protein RseA
MDGISALMDGELDEREAQRELGKLKDDAELRERWDTFHLVGDALRGERLLPSVAFRESVTQRLAAEPTVLAPRRTARQTKRIATYALSAAASVSAAALVAWVAIAPTGSGGLQTAAKAPGELTTALVPPSEALAGAPLATVSSNGSMNEYLLAHQGFSPSTALQGLAPYIRSVSATTRPADGR